MAQWVCKKCDGMGMLVVERADGGHLAEPCEACREERRLSHLRRRIRVPERFLQCTLDNYRCDFQGADKSLSGALLYARKFVREYPHGFKGLGLLFTGPVGTGKTHLAVGILQALVAPPHRVSGLFCDNRQLLKAINNSYNPRVDTTELEVLKPVFEAEVLVLDELDSSIKQTEWVADMIAHILNTRYNEQRTTIITTNSPNLPALARGSKGRRGKREEWQSPSRPREAQDNENTTCDDIWNRKEELSAQSIASTDPRTVDGAKTYSPARSNPIESRSFKNSGSQKKASITEADEEDSADAGSVMNELTLGDRIGTRMFSRLSEMCVAVELKGTDYRQGLKKARFE